MRVTQDVGRKRSGDRIQIIAQFQERKLMFLNPAAHAGWLD